MLPSLQKTVAALAFTALFQVGQAQVSFNRGVYNFGYLQLGKPATGEFLVTNNSKKTLAIEKTWAGCGCTTPKPSAKIIAPGQTIKLTVTFNAGAEETFLKEVYLKFKELESVYVLRVKGVVLSPNEYKKKFSK